MDITKFLNFFIVNNGTEIVKYGIEKSQFNSGVPFSKICLEILQHSKYDQFNLAQTGLPRKPKDDQKITYCKSFNQALDNLQCIFNYEIVKHILFRINSRPTLLKILYTIKQTEQFKLNDLRNWFNLWFRLYNSSGYTIDPNKSEQFTETIKASLFYTKHPTTNINGVITNIMNDLNNLENQSINTVMDVKETSVKLLKLILDCSIINNKHIIVDSISNLIIDNMNEFDIGYRGSYLKILLNYYLLNPDHTQVTETYMLSPILSELSQKILNYHVTLLDSLKVIHPEFEIEFTDKFQSELINVLFDFYIYLGIEITKEHNLLKCFEQSTRIHFRTLYTSLVSILPKGVTYLDSQVTLLHYALLTSEDIKKGISLIPEIMSEINKAEE